MLRLLLDAPPSLVAIVPAILERLLQQVPDTDVPHPRTRQRTGKDFSAFT